MKLINLDLDICFFYSKPDSWNMKKYLISFTIWMPPHLLKYVKPQYVAESLVPYTNLFTLKIPRKDLVN